MAQKAEDAFDDDESDVERGCEREGHAEAAMNIDMLVAEKVGRMIVMTAQMSLAAVAMAESRVVGMARPVGMGRWHHMLNLGQGAAKIESQAPQPVPPVSETRPLSKPQAARRVSCRTTPDACALAAS